MILKYNNFIAESINYENVRDKKELFSKDSGFDTPKKINRSAEVVPKELLEKIENGITYETLNDIDLPIFKYKTQITIHGIFDQLTQSRIGHYKSIFQNANKSIGIKQNAIDYNKKKLVYSAMRKCGYGITHNSMTWYATKYAPYNEENLNKFKEDFNKIDDSMYVGTKNLYIGSIPFMGTFIFIDVKINAIYEKNIQPFLEKSFDMSESKFNEIERIKKEEEEKRRAESKIEFDEQDKKRELEKEQKIKEAEDKYQIINNISEIPENDCVMFYYPDGYSGEYIIKKYTKNGNVVFQTMQYNSYNKDSDKETINQRLSKYDKQIKHIENIFSNNKVFLYKVFGEAKKEIKKEEPKTNIKDFNTFTKTETPKIKPNVQILDYGDKAVAVFGNTYQVKDILSILGGRFNKFLTNPSTNKKEAGQIFSKSKKDDLLKHLKDYL